MEIDVSRLVDRREERSGRMNPFLLVLKRIFLGVRLRKLEPFYFQLSTMLSSGVSIVEALTTLSEQHRGRAHRVFDDLAEHVSRGGSLSAAVVRYPETFDRFALAMVRSGESSGGLDTNLGLLGETIERFRNLRTRVITALLYPAILVHLAVLIPNLLILVKFGFWPYVEVCLRSLVPIYAVVTAVWFLHQVLRQTRLYSEFILGMFFFGGVARKIALARLSRALASLHDAGVPVGTALETAGEAATNGTITEVFRRASKRVLAGRLLSESIADAPHIDPLVLSMVETGERTGRLGDTLRKLAEYYDHEAYTAIERAAKVIPVLIYVGIAVYIGYKVVSFWLGYYGL
jgi:type II secretory pathway component PulF